MADRTPTEREPRTPQIFDPLAEMVGVFARDFVHPKDRVEAIDRLYVLLREARSGAAEAAIETGGLELDRLLEPLPLERPKTDAALEALKHLFLVMERLDKQAGPPFSEDHQVKITTEAWLRLVRPAIELVQARLSVHPDREDAPDGGGAT